MATTRRFRQLESELRRLAKHFLPRKWSPTGTYSRRRYDHTYAFRVFAHAEIEAFIEEVLLTIVEAEYAEWKKSRKPNHVVICLVAAGKVGWTDAEAKELGLVPLDVQKIKKDDDSIHQMIDRVVAQYRELIKANNGIKMQDLKRILMPVGIALSDLDETWLGQMNSFAGQRGFVAHTSRLGMKNPPDPQAEKKMVDDLLIGLRKLDELLRSA